MIVSWFAIVVGIVALGAIAVAILFGVIFALSGPGSRKSDHSK